MRFSILATAVVIMLSSCIPDGIKKEVNDSMELGLQMIGDEQFKKAIGSIELHKLRNGVYPSSLSELQFVTAFDSTMFHYVEYARLDSGYPLDMKIDFPMFDEEDSKKKSLKKYPPEFWRGLGCVQSNVK